MKETVFGQFRCCVCLKPVRSKDTFFASQVCDHRFCATCTDSPRQCLLQDHFNCECLAKGPTSRLPDKGLLDRFETVCDLIKLQKCPAHDNAKKGTICLDPKCKRGRTFSCMQCFTDVHGRCNLSFAYSVERFFRSMKPDIGLGLGLLSQLAAIAAHNDLIFEGVRGLEVFIRREIAFLLDLTYDDFQNDPTRLRVSPCDDYVTVSLLTLAEIERYLNEAKNLCLNFVPIFPVNAALARIEELTGVRTRLIKGACSHPVTLPAATTGDSLGGVTFGVACCCLCEENSEKKVNVVKTLNAKLREKMETMTAKSPELVLAFDEHYQIELRELTQWTDAVMFLKEADAQRLAALDFLEKRMGVQEKNEATRVQREDLLSQKMLQIERNDGVRASDLSKLNKKIELLIIEIAKLSQDRTQTNAQVATLTQQVTELRQEKVRMRSEITQLTDELFKVHQQKKLLNDIVGDLNKIIEDIVEVNRGLKGEVALLRKALQPVNPRLEFVTDATLEKQTALLFRDSVFLNENHFRFFSDLVPGLKDASLIFSMKRHGGDAEKFHDKCDFKGATLTVIRSGKWIAGGFSDQSWDTSDTTKSSTGAFLFSFNRNRKYKLKKDQAPYAVCCMKERGPVFGGNGDLVVCSVFDSCANYSNLGSNYEAEGAENPQNELFGTRNFFIEDLEVYQLKL